ncbi:DUF6612 family protein [Dethiobacter alkaliphilus]|uniref:Lipoprotein n=1 Tax=Dethiobacter alkaliphilus AHT 1 TaxID=555088 RepID=C0GK77_DETAL|nr:DUF6612 family protein [Dethiobacter alkaliphilus]EEG76260.1 hypothetical protein DealDRAFT_2886 [Dethiobacter alkaliphilus AHT 1]
MLGKSRLGLPIVLVLLMGLIAGCSGTEEALKAAEIYAKSIEAMSEVNSYEFDIEMFQVMEMPESVQEPDMPDKLEIQTRGTGRAVMDPVAMEMTLSMHMPFLVNFPEAAEFGDLEMQMYMVENQMYIYDSMSGIWMSQDLGDYGLELEDLMEFSMDDTDPMQLLTMLGDDGAAAASLKTVDNKYYLITLEDAEGEVMQRIIDEYIKDELADSLAEFDIEAAFEELFDMATFADIRYKIWIDMESYYTTKAEMSFSIVINIEGETIKTTQTALMAFKDFNTFDSITVPDKVKDNAVPLVELFEFMELELQ